MDDRQHTNGCFQALHEGGTLPLCGLDAQKHLALQVVPVQQVSKADILLREDILCSTIYLQEVQYIRQHRTIWQEHSAKDFASYESYKRAGILYVFPPFITARMGQKIGRRPQTQLCGAALRVKSSNCKVTGKPQRKSWNGWGIPKNWQKLI